MSILYNGGSDPSKVYYNSVDLSKVYYNGTLVWESYREIVTLDFDNNIPTGINLNPSDPTPQDLSNIQLYSPKGFGDLNQGNTEPNMGQYEIGYKVPDGQTTPEYSGAGNFIPTWRPSTIVNVTNYNTCLVEAYVQNPGYSSNVQFLAWGAIGSAQYGMFTMLNNTELRDLCGNWVEKPDQYGQPSGTYWWDQENLYPNNYHDDPTHPDHTIPNEGYNPIISADPTPDWWSEVPWNRKLGFAFHTWSRTYGTPATGADGPILFSKSDFATYGQAVKFSIKDLTGNRPLRCLLLPFSAIGTHTTDGGDPVGMSGYEYGYVYITKITLNTNKCEQ